MGGTYSLEYREPFFGGPLTTEIDHQSIDVVSRQAQEWQHLERLDGPLLCLACREIGHGLRDCRWEGDPPQLQRAQEHCNLANYVRREALGLSELCGRCKTLSVDRVFNCDDGAEEQISSKTFTDTETYTRQDFYLSHCTDLVLFLRCSLCRLLFTVLPVVDRRKDLFIDVEAMSARSRFGFEPLKQSCGEAKVSIDATVLTGVSVSKDEGHQHYGTGAIGLASQNVPRSRSGLCARSTRNQLDKDIIMKWIESCVSTHGSVCNETHTKVLPLRMIDVQSGIIVRSADLVDPEYFCLSYVWGRQRYAKMQLTAVNLPQTIQDAILLVQRLGERYLWVDAVCIDQSNSEEVISQIQIMDEIYRGALCTIVALEGENSEAGIPFINPDIEITPQLSAHLQGKVLLSLFPALAEIIEISSWGKRGWTFQEFLLSNRLLFFTSYQVYFQCSLTECCQSIDDTNSEVHSNPMANVISPYGRELGPTGATDKPFRRTLKTIVDGDRVDARRGFQRLVSAYSALQLSYASDKLRAFAGIMNRLTQLLYTAGFYWGLPVSDLGMNLNWDFPWSMDQERLVERISEFPSWSWAGWNAIITFPFVRVEEVGIAGDGEDDCTESEQSEGRLCFWQWVGTNNLQSIPNIENTKAESYGPRDISALNGRVRHDHILGVHGRCLVFETIAYYEPPKEITSTDDPSDEIMNPPVEVRHNPSVGVRYKDEVLNLYGYYPGTLDRFIGKPYTMLILITERYAVGSLVYTGILMEENGGVFTRLARVSLTYPTLDEQNDGIPIEERDFFLV